MTEETTETTFKFKVFKGHLRIDIMDGEALVERIKLSYPQWEALQGSKQASKNSWRSHLPGDWWLPGGGHESERKLEHLGLAERREYQTKDHWQRDTTQSVRTLSALGEQVLALMPKCPPRDKWTTYMRNRDATKLTAHQRKVLMRWTQHVTKAIPHDGDSPEEGHWCAGADRQDVRTYEALARAEMLERGLRGATLIDGKLQVTGEVETVYRRTVLGALVGD